MSPKLENRIILFLSVVLVIIGTLGCARSIQNCEFNPGVTVESKPEDKEGETRKESEIKSKLPVKVSPKGEFVCSF